uniref:RING-type E3 ubiquitin transferase n=1 Tax=Ananas comosus var. bracteatus TaxID=296719 RepID=A0A6V7Q5G4_ANACO|nr:unnamed protein product [Ananas comosus var. bracteatus]
MPPRLVAVLLALFLLAAGRNIIVSGSEDDDDFFKKCPASRCAEGGPDIRFPYRLDSSPSFCGAPGMELSCSGNDTVLALPHAGSFIVTTIDYRYGEITIKLGGSCLHGLTGNLGYGNLTASVYEPLESYNISLLGCPRKWTPADEDYVLIAGPISCLSTASQLVYVVFAYDDFRALPSDCRVIADNLTISFRRMTKSNYDWPTFKEWAPALQERVADLITRGEVTLTWSVPQITDTCVQCEKAKKYCGFSSATNQAFCRHGPNIKLIAVYFYTRSKKEKEIRLKVEKFLASYNTIKPTRYTFSELKKITKSFGMLVMGMVGGRRNVDPQIENQSEFYFPEWIYDQLVNGQDIGPAIEIANTSEIEIAKKLAIVALWCIQWDPMDRPSMTKVVQMLIGDSQNLQMPPTPFVSSPVQEVLITAPNEL